MAVLRRMLICKFYMRLAEAQYSCPRKPIPAKTYACKSLYLQKPILANVTTAKELHLYRYLVVYTKIGG